MKITTKQYAQSLYESTVSKKGESLTESLENFVKILAANNDISRVEAVMTEFEKTWQVAEEVVLAEVTSAERLEAETLNQLKAFVLEQTGAKEVELSHNIDHKLLAGFILRFNDEIVDGSAKAMIGNLKKELIK